MAARYEYRTLTHQVGQRHPDITQTLDYYCSQGWQLTHFSTAPGDCRLISLQRPVDG